MTKNFIESFLFTLEILTYFAGFMVAMLFVFLLFIVCEAIIKFIIRFVSDTVQQDND